MIATRRQDLLGALLIVAPFVGCNAADDPPADEQSMPPIIEGDQARGSLPPPPLTGTGPMSGAGIAGGHAPAPDANGAAAAGHGDVMQVASAGSGGAAGMMATAGAAGETDPEPAPEPLDCTPRKAPSEVVVVKECATRVRLDSPGGGFGLAPPAGSDCHGEREYTLEIERGELSWSVCRNESSGVPWMLSSGTRMLSDDELQQAVEGLRTVTVWDQRMACGADKPTMSIEVTTTRGTQVYFDSFYACTNLGEVYIDGIDYAFTSIAQYAHP